MQQVWWQQDRATDRTWAEVDGSDVFESMLWRSRGTCPINFPLVVAICLSAQPVMLEETGHKLAHNESSSEGHSQACSCSLVGSQRHVRASLVAIIAPYETA